MLCLQERKVKLVSHLATHLGTTLPSAARGVFAPRRSPLRSVRVVSRVITNIAVSSDPNWERKSPVVILIRNLSPQGKGWLCGVGWPNIVLAILS